MNDFFDSGRFRRLLCTDIRNGSGKVRILAAAMLGIYAAVAAVGFFLKAEISPPDRNAVLFLFWIVFAFCLPFLSYGKLNSPGNGSFHIQMPVSVYEKFSSMVLVSAAVFPLLFAVVLYSLDYILVFLSGGRGFAGLAFGGNGYALRDLASDYLNIVLIQSVSLCGNMVFSRHKAMSTILVAALFHIAAFGILRLAGVGLEDVAGTDAGGRSIAAALTLAYKYGLPAFLYAMAFFRLKRLQVSG